MPAPLINVKRFSRSKMPSITEEPSQPDNNSDELTTSSNNISLNITENDDDFLNELNSDVYRDEKELEKEEQKNKKTEREKIKDEKERIRLEKDRIKLQKEKEKLGKSKPFARIEDDDGLFSDVPTEILGLDRRALLAKIREYKALFPDKLKTFKIKKNPSLEDLQAYVSECDAIVATSGVNEFLTDSILQCLKMVEGVTIKTKYNISGMSEMLKQNPKFHELCKMLYIKYKVFAQIPPEFQMLMLVSTTAIICKTKNDKKAEFLKNVNLNEPFIDTREVVGAESVVI